MRRVLAFALMVTVGALGVAGCRNAPGLSNGSVSACYRAIPKAIAASGDTQAHLVGVHRIPADHVMSHLPPSSQAILRGDNDTTVCAVALKGAFKAGQVKDAPTSEHGDYALVLLTSRKLDLLGSAVLNHLPKSLGTRTL